MRVRLAKRRWAPSAGRRRPCLVSGRRDDEGVCLRRGQGGHRRRRPPAGPPNELGVKESDRFEAGLEGT